MTSTGWIAKITGQTKAKYKMNIINREQVKSNIRTSVDQQFKNLLEQLPTDVVVGSNGIIGTFTSVMMTYKRHGRSQMKNFVYLELISKFIERYEVFPTKEWLEAVDLGPELEMIMKQSGRFPWINWN